MATDEAPDGVEISPGKVGLTCLCGYEIFQRVVVQRKPGAPIVTDFLACVGCRAMYLSPVVRPPPPVHPPAAPREQSVGSGGGPHAAPAPNTWGMVHPGFTREETREELQAIKDAAAKANKSKPRGLR